MASKIKLMKMLQEIQGISDLGRMQLPPKPSLYLMQLRSRVNEANRSRRRIIISVDLKDEQGLPDPVHIRHVRPSAQS
ncbi:MAG TPA: hypothetical protein GYA07_14955 [Verrucomicrobia bacterium]|nr:hypothetical protein [Verrucomicrobiota bacterium]HOP96211.1 hypothetical protein [Verrucomicrobiota bacterium]